MGKERGSDVIMFIMETGPSSALDLVADGPNLPGTGPLFGRAFVATEHYTTHPYSSDALYSILTGLYPQGRRRMVNMLDGAADVGLMSRLRTTLPARRVYLPSLYKIENDERMYTGLGAVGVYSSDRETSDTFRAVGEQRADELLSGLEARGGKFPSRVRSFLRARLRADLQALEKMKADLRWAARSGTPYWMMYFPEIGHGPWQPLHGETSVRARGSSLMRLQDMWLREIVDLLRTLGRLESTVIVLTADHGVRTRAEDPALPVGRISNETFRVPLLIYAPRALAGTRLSQHPSSHIDLAPTVLALVGATSGLSRMQGVPIWQRTADDRLYVLASEYGGADGFTQAGNYYMRQALSGAVYRAESFAFEDRTQLQPGDAESSAVDRALDDFNALQYALVGRALAMVAADERQTP